MIKLFKECPIPDEHILTNLNLFGDKDTVGRFLFMHELYLHALKVPGIIIEFGTRFGHNLALFEQFRALYEPYNFTRRIVGFDTFEGFPSIHTKDGTHPQKKMYNVTKGYEKYLEQVLECAESKNPLARIKRFKLVKGDAVETIDKYLKKRPETVVAMAYFDLDLYEPTKKCLDAIKPHLVKGSVLGFDELNWDKYPGETLALQESMGLNNCRLKCFNKVTTPSGYFIYE